MAVVMAGIFLDGEWWRAIKKSLCSEVEESDEYVDIAGVKVSRG